MHKGYKCLSADGRIFISKDVIFNEHSFPYSTLFSASKSTDTLSVSEALLPLPVLNNEPAEATSEGTRADVHTSDIVAPATNAEPDVPVLLNNTKPVADVPSSAATLPVVLPSAVNTTNIHPMVTRGKTGNLKPKAFLTHIEPSSVKQALLDPKWLAAIKAEYQALIDNNTWTLTTLPSHRKAIGCRWVFRVKENADGSINKFKARLVAKGYSQQPGQDFGETFSPVVKPVTIRVLLTLALTHQWHIEQIDVNNAFINGHIEEEIYMQQPPGFVAADKSLVYRLHRSLYGLKQAPRAWYERLKQSLVHFGFHPSKCDASLFVYSHKGVQLYALVYVDDILITGSSSVLVKDLIAKLHKEFALKQLGRPDFFLGIEVHHLPSGELLLTQSKYIRDLLTRANMHACNGLPTPMVSTVKLTKQGTDLVADPHLYRSIVGALQYITLTRPDIAFSVNKVCQFLASPLTAHWCAVKRILRYLAGTQHHGLMLKPTSRDTSLSLRAYSDSDWANDVDDRRSTSGSCIFLGPNLVSWSSKKQMLVARSSAEAEYRAMAHATSELLWLQSLLRELGVVFQTPTLLCDNLSAVMLAHNPILHACTKHLELDIHFVREKVEGKSMIIKHVPAHLQLADLLTKLLSTKAFLELRPKLKVASSLKHHLDLEGGVIGKCMNTHKQACESTQLEVSEASKESQQ